ncbi:hypothetical protein KC19_1G048300 [Ceratodon purpureus]|uniref:Uncharacterized protein n=1 Tax=Ceratodon purpureus TaxID=3225 RepID=A0A8T0J4V2_CERPU|nr:hypothetical protein KC19_1G048300 [Ceratodon purpureus]
MDYKPVKDFGDLAEPLQSPEPGAVVGAQYCSLKAEQFTLENAIFSKDWSITNANGQEVYRVRGKRVDWCKAKRELVDMDGNTIVLMEQKPWSFMGAWRAFEPDNKEQPLWTMKKSSFCSFGPKLQIFLPSNAEREIPDYTIKGQWLCKKCTIFLGEQKVAEVVRDASLKNVLIEKSIFHVLVQPGVDTAFIFSLIVIMDKLYVHNCKNHGGGYGGPGGGP